MLLQKKAIDSELYLRIMNIEIQLHNIVSLRIINILQLIQYRISMKITSVKVDMMYVFLFFKVRNI